MKMLMKTLASVTLAGVVVLPCAAQAQEWSGPYVGASFGSAKSGEDGETLVFDKNLDGDFSDTVNTAGGANAFSPGFCDGAAIARTPGEGCKGDREDGGFGARIGYDWQNGNFVYGVVLDASGVDVRDSVTGFSSTPAAYVFTRHVDTLAAVRARLGYVINDWLVYGTAGYATAEIERSFATTNALNSFTATDGEDGSGAQYGVGLEKRINDRWKIGVEYLQTTIDDEAPVVRAGPSANTFASNPFLIANTMGTDMRRSSDEIKIETIHLTVTYRFGGM
jgi:outer membrane immunogenic protein